jgi:hypothetical protein
MQNTRSPTRQEVIHQWVMEMRLNTIHTCEKEAKTKTTACITNDKKLYNLVTSTYNTLTPNILLPFLVLYLWCVLNTVTTVFKELI